MSRQVWKALENKIYEARIAEVERERTKERKDAKREKKKEFRKLTIEIVRIIEEKQKEEKDLIEIRMVEKIVLRRFHKYLKVFEKKELERMPMKKTWNHAINLRKGFVMKKRKIYSLLRIEREKVQEFVKNQLRKRYIRPSKSLQMLLVFFLLKKDGKKRIV